MLDRSTVLTFLSGALRALFTAYAELRHTVEHPCRRAWSMRGKPQLGTTRDIRNGQKQQPRARILAVV